METHASTVLVVGVDTGGTFTDIVYRDGRRRGRYKVLSTPDDPARAVTRALRDLFGPRAPSHLGYGTTVATNAMIERRGARTVLITTAGFEDLIEIGRQARAGLYDLEPCKTEPLVARPQRLGARERMLHDGSVELALGRREIKRLAALVQQLRAQSVAVCLLHCSANPAHEKLLGKALAGLDIPFTLSHQLSPQSGEYERCATTVANAYVRPKLSAHIDALGAESKARKFRVMQSNGGIIPAELAAREPVRTMLSGPAGGVAAAFRCARAAGYQRVITLDMGGTSTDVALIDAGIPHREFSEVAGVALRVPCIDIHTVGAGGGSIAFVDEGGSLKVGPQSAGADPGPACYGKGAEATVTDANLLLGRIIESNFLGGRMHVDVARARQVLSALAVRMGCKGAEQAAEGIVRVVEGNMERAVRLITVERGKDPRSATIVAFGGAAGLHACGLAEQLGIERVLLPPDPGLFSALGVADGPLLRDQTLALKLTDPPYEKLQALARKAAAATEGSLKDEGIAQAKIKTSFFVRMRYLGQSIEIEVPLSRGFRRSFESEHSRLYHYASPQRSVEVTSLRVSSAAAAAPPVSRRRAPKRITAASISAAKTAGRVPVFLRGRRRQLPLYERDSLKPGQALHGPAIVVEYSSTLLLRDSWRLTVDAGENLVLERKAAGGSKREGPGGTERNG